MERSKKSESNIIEVVLNGGLGNQLFGWGLGFALSRRNGCELRLNASNLTGRPFELGKMGIHAVDLPPKSKYPLGSDFASRIRIKLFSQFNFDRHVYAERGFRYDPLVKDLPPGTTLYGYFQSWKYLEDSKNQIRSKILENFPNSPEYIKFKSIIPHTNYVAVHIRRGDYIGREDFHGLTTPEYYKKALMSLEGKSPREIICFSDSIDIAREVMPDCSRYFGPESLNDPVAILRVMSEATAIIGSNSSLSWWAAYLMNTRNPKIFPAKWFANPDLDTTDLLPPEWKTIE